MTPAQDKKYWRRWSAVVRGNHWRMVKSRLDPQATTTGSPAHAAVWAAASARAVQHLRGITADDLRHACHSVALGGRDKSHTAFTNREFDALLNYWGDERDIAGLLLDPLNLSSLISEDAHAAQKIHERQLRWLKTQCLGGYVMAESERLFGTKDWEQLPAADLARLHDHLRARPNAQLSVVGRASPRAAATEPDAFDPDWNV
ncbi:MAG: hypothetical protein IPK82_23430 [Polyangiaceae bacterium]|nr:hypothetical protein [Polyangiaceae bacterium]